VPFQSSLKLRVMPADLDHRRRNLIVVASSVGVIALMGALTYYSVPLYRLFCQATGLGGTTQTGMGQSDAYAMSQNRCRTIPLAR
jgi:cytochrome c oxidase assembly protein subunit 11